MFFLLSLQCLIQFDIYYITWVGWKKIVYTENGPIESLGRCKQEEVISNIIITGLLIRGIYEIYDVDEPNQMSLYHNNNLVYIYFENICDLNNCN